MSVTPPVPPQKRKHTPTRFLLRGLAISLPAILTLVILVWIGGLVQHYIIEPTSLVVRYSISQLIDESRPTKDLSRGLPGLPPLPYTEGEYLITPDLHRLLERRLRERQEAEGRELAAIPAAWLQQNLEDVYVPLGDRAVPYSDYSRVRREMRPGQMPNSARGVYMELVTLRYFGSQFLLSAVAVSITVVLLYFLGRLVTVRLGAWGVHKFETAFLARLPLVSQVYGSVKQVTDFVFSERQIEYNRVVALEYPRRGIWAIGFVTGDGMLETAEAAREPLVSVLMPTSPMPMTGFTIMVPRSHIIDLNITVDQAFQFCLSCGVLVPPQQKVTPEALEQIFVKRIPASEVGEQRLHGDGSPPADAPPHDADGAEARRLQAREEAGTTT